MFEKFDEVFEHWWVVLRAGDMSRGERENDAMDATPAPLGSARLMRAGNPDFSPASSTMPPGAWKGKGWSTPIVSRSLMRFWMQSSAAHARFRASESPGVLGQPEECHACPCSRQWPRLTLGSALASVSLVARPAIERYAVWERAME
jgi:hypothetical protein